MFDGEKELLKIKLNFLESILTNEQIKSYSDYQSDLRRQIKEALDLTSWLKSLGIEMPDRDKIDTGDAS